MNDLKKGIMGCLLIFSLLTGCLNPFTTQEGVVESRTDAEYEAIKQSNQNRAEVIRRTSEAYSGEKCSSEQRRHECYKSCDDIYSSRGDETDCQELTVRQIEKLKELSDVLEEARGNDLAGIEPDIFELYLSFSIRPLDDLIDDFQRRNQVSRAENIMIWLVQNENMAKIFEDEDEDYKTLNKLLNVIEPFESNQIYVPFSKVVDSSDTLMDIIAKERDSTDFALKWIMDFIGESPSCSDTVTESCFEVYCKIGAAMNKDDVGRLLNREKEVFRRYIEDILEADINIDNWSPPSRITVDDLEDVDDLDDNWVENLCRTLT